MNGVRIMHQKVHKSVVNQSSYCDILDYFRNINII